MRIVKRTAGWGTGEATSLPPKSSSLVDFYSCSSGVQRTCYIPSRVRVSSSPRSQTLICSNNSETAIHFFFFLKPHLETQGPTKKKKIIFLSFKSIGCLFSKHSGINIQILLYIQTEFQ